MSDTLFRSVLLPASLILGLMLVQGCDQTPEPETLVAPSSLFAHVPADTPYVYGSLEPAPRAFIDKMFQIYGDMGQMYLAAFEQARRNYSTYARKANGAAGEEVPADPLAQVIDEDALGRLVDAVAAEFDGKMSPEGLLELGFRTDGTGVIYGLGPLPVARFELADAARVEALLRRIEQRSGLHGDWRSFGGREYLRIGDEVAGILLGTVGEQMVVALLPSSIETAYLPRLFGDQRPEASLVESGVLAEMIKTHDFTGYGAGFVDLERIASMLTGRAKGETAEVLAALSLDMPQPSAACTRLIDSLTAGAPRMAFGITALDERSIGAKSVLETSPAVAQLLGGLSEPVPGIGRDSDAKFSFGTGMNVPNLRGALRKLGQHILAQGEGCEWVEPGQIRQSMAQLDLALGPMTAMFKGVFVEALDLQLDRDTLQPDMDRLKLRALAQVDDPAGVFAMIGMFNPALAQLEVPNDGSPVQVPRELLPPGVPDLYVGIRGKSLVLASGVDGGSMIGDLLDSTVPDQPPLMTMSYDMQALAPLIRIGLDQQIALLEADGAEAELIRATRDQGEAMLKVYENYGQARMTVLANDRGLVFDTRTEFK